MRTERQVREYFSIMSAEGMHEFMKEDQNWNFAGECHNENHSAITAHEGVICSKDIAVECDDGIMYSGIAETYHVWSALNKPSIVMRFVLGKSQENTESLDRKMGELGFEFSGRYNVFRGE